MHNERLIHRDVKPANLLLNRRRELLLSDFGIAVIAHSSRSQRREEIVGTISYMAPEQIQGKPCRASDQYSLGVITYEWLTGNCPFSGSFAEVAAQHCLAVPPLVNMVRLGIPDAVEAVVLRTLAKRPEQRFAGVRAFALALERAAMPMKAASLALPGQERSGPRRWTLEDDFEGVSTW